MLDSYEEVFRDLATKEYNKETMLEYGWYGANSSDVRTGYVNGIPTNGSGGTFGKGGAQMIAMPTLYLNMPMVTNVVMFLYVIMAFIQMASIK